VPDVGGSGMWHTTVKDGHLLLSDSYEQTECPPSSYRKPTLLPRRLPARDFDDPPDPRYVWGKAHEGGRQRGRHGAHETHKVDGLLIGRFLGGCRLVRHRLGWWWALTAFGRSE